MKSKRSNLHLWLFKTIKIIALSTVLVLSLYFGRTITFEEQMPYFEALRSTAAVISSVVGIWIAIIYPERLRYFFKGESSSVKEEQSGSFGILLNPLIVSLTILLIILLIGIIFPLVERSVLFIKKPEIFQGASYLALVSLTLWQIWAILLTFIPADLIKTKSDLELNKEDIRKSRGSNRLPPK